VGAYLIDRVSSIDRSKRIDEGTGLGCRVLRDRAGCDASPVSSTWQIREPGLVWEGSIESIPPHIGDVRPVFLRDAVAMGHRLQAQVHQLAAVGEVMEDVRHINVSLMIEVGKFSGEKRVDDVAVLPLHP
jgi:hypothetical protein